MNPEMAIKKKKLTKKEQSSLASYRAHDELKKILFSLEEISDEERIHLNHFLELYTKCEMIYKKLYSAYKKTKDETEIDPTKLKINVQRIETSLRWCGICYDDTEVKKIFSADKSYKKPGKRACSLLRNEILHNHNNECIQEVIERNAELIELMERFISNALKIKTPPV